METLTHDIRYAARTLWRRPGFTALALVTVALGIGANTAIFTVVNAVLLTPLPYPNPDQLVMVWEQDRTRGWDRVPTSAEDYLSWREQARSLTLGGGSNAAYSLTSDGDPEQVPGFRVTAEFFQVFGVAPALGSVFGPEANVQGADRLVVLSDRLWTRRYGADPGIVGRTIQVDGAGYTVVAVMPPGFQFPSTAQMWTPVVFSEDQLQDRNWHFFLTVGRVADGVEIEGARTEMKTIAARLADVFPDSNGGWTADVMPMHAELTNQVRGVLWVLLGAVGFVLLIACANVANLLLVRASGRTRELAVRTALGAGRRRLVRQLLTESVLLAGMGGLLGLGLAYLGLDALLSLSPITVPGGREVRMDVTVLAFTAVGALVTGVLFGAAPVASVLKTDLHGSLKEGGRGQAGGTGQRLRGFLVVAEVALALVLVTGAGLMVQSVRSLLDVEVGVDTDNVLLAQFSLPPAKYPQAEGQVLFLDQLLEHATAIPGVRAAALTSVAPPASGGQFHVRIEGVHDAWTMDLPVARSRSVSPGYFEAMGIPLVRGRTFTRDDRAGGARVVIVDEAFVTQHFPDEDPIGKRIRTLEDEPREIIGVVGNVANTGLGNEAQPTDYLPYAQTMFGSTMTLAMRTGGEAMTFLPAVREAIWGMDRDLPLVNVGTLEDRLSTSVAQPRFNSTMLTLFAVLALVLAGVGIYGVMAYTVSERTTEIGLRMALGASGGSVRGLVVGKAMALTSMGIVVGVLAALGLGRVLRSFLFGVAPSDPRTLVAVAVILAAVAFLASYLPALRASRMDPLEALRSD
jgi:putative ABC transport system permease protein